MKLLVTGGAGFIGSNFILYWMKKYPQDKIVNLDKLTYAGNLENLKSVENNSNYKFVKEDLCNLSSVNSLVRNYKIEVIVHFAAESHVDRSIIQPDLFIKTNVQGTYVLLEAALKNKVRRFHHISTDEVFGTLPLNTDEKFNEKTPYNPRSPYSASKAASDHLVRAYYHTYSLPITISNCSNNFGPYQFPEKLIPLAITNVLEGKKVPIYGDGLYVRDWLYVDDHCRGIDMVIKQGKVGKTYLMGGMNKQIPNIEIIKKILKIMKKSEDSIEYVQDRPGHDRRYTIDWSKINKELGWEPKYDFETYLKMTVEWYIKNQNWWKRVKSGEYLHYYKNQYDKKIWQKRIQHS